MPDRKSATNIIWSPYTSGHHPMYLRVLLETMDAAGPCNVTIAVGSRITDDARWPLLLELIEKINGQLIFLDFNGDLYPCDSLIGQIRQRNLLASLLSTVTCSRLYIPFSDSIWLALYVIGLPRNRCGSLWLLWMRNQSHLPLRAVKAIAEWLKLKSAQTFQKRYHAVNYTVDPCFFDWAAKREGSRGIFQYIPEPVLDLRIDMEPIQQERLISILAIGVLDERKDFGTLIDAFAGLQPGRAVLRLVGTLSESCLQRIEGLPPAVRERIYIHNAVVSDAVYCSELHSADIIWNVRSTHLLSSGTLAHAIANRKVVLCSTEGCTGYWGRRYRKAILCIDNPLDALKSALDAVEHVMEVDETADDEQLTPFTRSWGGYL